MKSAKGFAGAAVVLAAIPLALASQILIGDGAETVLHLAIGAGFVLFATSVFDFAVPRWLSWIGGAAAAAFGTIFLMQGVAEIAHIEGLTYLAFDILGQQIERFLPDAVFAWFLALLLVDSRGKSSILGWMVMPIVIGMEIASLVGVLIGVDMPNFKILFLLPFVWLLVESAKGFSFRGAATTQGRSDLAESAAS